MSQDTATRHPHLLDRSRALVLVVDIQDAFLKAIHERERVVANSVKLIQAARVFDLPTLVTVQNQERMGPTTAAVAAALPEEASPLDKMTFSCGCAPGFDKLIEDTGRDQVLICGVETHVCISQTAHDLLAQGYQVHVARDAVSSRTRDNWKTGIERMRDSGCIITSTESAIFELMVDASLPEFKQILPIVK